MVDLTLRPSREPNAVVFSVVLGGVPVLLGLNFLWSMIAIVSGVVIRLGMVAFHALQGPRLGVPQMIQSRAQFGFYGAVLFFAASIALDFGFLAAQLVIQGQAMNLLIGSISIPAWIGIFSIPVVVLTIYGYNWIRLWQRWMSPILATTFAVLIVQAIRFGGLHGHAARTGAPSFALFMESAGLFVISMATWGPYVSDYYTRYLPASVNKAKLFWAVFLGCAIAAITTAVLGAYVTALLPDASSTVAAVQQVAGSWALPIMALSLVGADAVNAYTGMLALASIISCFKDVRSSKTMRVLGSLLIIALGTGCALLGCKSFVKNLSNFLAVLLFIFIPWTAINLTDYFALRHGEYDVPSFFTPHGEYSGFIWRGLIPYALAVAVELPFISQTYYTGPLLGPLGGIDISWVFGGIAGVVFYLIVGFRCVLHPPVTSWDPLMLSCVKHACPLVLGRVGGTTTWSTWGGVNAWALAARRPARLAGAATREALPASRTLSKRYDVLGGVDGLPCVSVGLARDSTGVPRTRSVTRGCDGAACQLTICTRRERAHDLPLCWHRERQLS